MTVSTPALLRRHVAQGRGPAALVAALVAVLAAAATALPLALAALDAATLRDRVGSLGPAENDLTSVTSGLPHLDDAAFAAGPARMADGWDPFLAALGGIRAAADPPLPEVMEPAGAVVRSLQNPIDGEERTRALTVAFDPDYRERVRLVAGTWPEPVEVVAGQYGLPGPPGVEVVVSEESAAEMQWRVGETRAVLARDGSTRVPFVLVGIFAAVDPDEDAWQHVRSVLSPQIFDDGNAPRSVTVTAYADPAGLVAALPLPGRSETTVWFPTRISAITGADADAAAAALRKFTGTAQQIPDVAVGEGLSALRFETALADAIDQAQAQSRATASVLAMMAAGPAGVAGTVVVLACRLLLERRRPTLRLLSARGASIAQLRVLAGAEGLVAGILPAAIGAAVPLLVVGAPPSPALLVAPALLGLLPAVLCAAAAGSAAERVVRTDLGRGSRVRAVAEGVVWGIAAVAVVLLFVRGYATGGFDPLLAATPLLVALAGSLLTLRLYPMPLSVLLQRARSRPGLAGFLGAARALRDPALGLIPVLALVVGVAVAVSSGILLSTLQSGVRDSADGRVGADILLSGAAFSDATLDAVRETPGVAAATGVSGAEPVQIETPEGTRGTFAHVVDAAELADVQGTHRGILPPATDLTPTAGAVPVVASARLAALVGGGDVRVGEVDGEIVAVATGQTPLSSRENWIALDVSVARDVLGRDPVDRLILVRVSPDGAGAPEVAERLREAVGPGVRIQTPDDIVGLLESGPALQGLRWTLATATAASALLGALAIVLTLALAGAARGRMLALLRAVGAPRRTERTLVAWEIAPPAVAALLAGTGVGALLPLLVLGAVDLRPFTGSTVAPSYAVDPLLLGVVLGGFVALAALSTLLALRASRRARASATLRTVAES